MSENTAKPADVQAKSTHALREERVLAFWKEKGIFAKTLGKQSPKGEFTFYDGPPFATGMPHYGHIIGGTMKDVIPRWKTMQGYHVARKWGWDCHGLPVENLIEKELGLKTKKDILEYGIEKFNAAAQKSVMRYADEWRKIVPRLGRFVDMDDDYRTMDSSYTESVWWIFKTLYDKGLIYEGFKSMNLCPRCETTLSNFEVAQGYKDITDISVYAKFKLKNSAKFGDNTYMIAWTTTPWTLPGNVALAVNPKIDYVRVHLIADPNSSADITVGSAGESFIVAESRLAASMKENKYEVVEKIRGANLIGLSYEPLFTYYSGDKSLKNRENAWKVYPGDFVTTEDGTGIVHIAPAFGADDYEMLKKHDLPFIQHVAVDGTFKKEVTDFAGQHVKPKSTDEDKNAHQKGDIEIIKYLAHNGGLFEKEKLVHSYPHCWRCETPLINYATSSWFVKVTDIKDKLVKVNNKIDWVPEEVGQGRFGNWLEGARDWAISRSRFWGAPIPVWREESEKGKAQGASAGKLHVIGSVADIKKYSRSKNNYFIMRHGQSENNVKDNLNSDPSKVFHLTTKGREEVRASSAAFKGKIDVIYSSPIARARETAEIFAKTVGLDPSSIKIDPRLIEMGMGELEGKPVSELFALFVGKGLAEHFNGSFRGVENNNSIKRRTGSFLDEIERGSSGKNIMVISHDSPLWLLESAAMAMDVEQTMLLKPRKECHLLNAQIKKLEFSPLPHNENYELDLHRPFIDDIELRTETGTKLVRVPDVFDCWFESGSMPWGSNHYPFGDLKEFNPRTNIVGKIFGNTCGTKAYPADFIAEGLDQTRGWFYSMLVLGVALFGTSPFKKVLVNGLVLAEDGEKMSKSKNNYPDPMLIVDKYGADSLRYYLMSSPAVRAQDLCFSEKGVDEVTKKVINRLLNVVTFYETYAKEGAVGEARGESQNILDQWIITRLNETIVQVTTGLEAGEIDRATRPFMDLIDDLSTWYLRRSRDRFKGDDLVDKNAALATTKFILLEIAKLMAPFTPFVSDDIYNRVGGTLESVHLESWPVATKVDAKLLADMKLARDIASQGLEARMSAKINVRQPLSRLSVKESKITDVRLEGLIKDEVNVKEILFGATIETLVSLDTSLTPALKEEGMVRELIRVIQDLRKEKGLTVSDKATLIIEADGAARNFIEKNREAISRTTSLKDIKWESVTADVIKIGDMNIKVGLN